MGNCKDIDGEILWVRTCPICGKEILHKNKKQRNFLDKNNKKCRSCGNKEVHKRRKLNPKKEEEYNKKISESLKGRKLSSETKLKISNYVKKHNPMRIQKNQIKLRKIQISRISELRNNGFQISPAFNVSGCEYLDKLSREMGWNIQHAMNGGEHFIEELGYWVDGYDHEKNIVVEYDEPHHEKMTEKDTKRQEEIKKLLKCRFYRYRESQKTLFLV